jgi:hypothetical protein
MARERGRPQKFEERRYLLERIADRLGEGKDLPKAMKLVLDDRRARREAFGNIQRASAERALGRLWTERSEEILQDRKNRAHKPFYPEKDLWKMIRNHPEWEGEITVETLECILARRDVINDPLLYVIAELVDRARE